jgi:hypothetical protein
MFKSIAFVSVRNGLVAGILSFVLLISLYYLGKHPFLFPIYFDFRIVVLLVFLAMSLKELRDDYQKGVLYFSQAMISCFIFTFIFALSVSVLIWAFGSVVPEFVSSYIKIATEQLQSIQQPVIEELGKDVYQQNLERLPTTKSIDLAIDYFGKTFIISFFLSIIISVILRRQPKI